MSWWSSVRFLHVLSAALWVGGQLTVSLMVLPIARRLLDPDRRAEVLRAIGRRFGVFTGAVFLPVQLATGVALARHNQVTWTLTHPGYGRVLAVALHGIASSRRQGVFARSMAIAALVGSVGVTLLATALPTA